jgi:hypothetical protein
MTFEQSLAKYGQLSKEHRIYEEKKKQDIDTLFGTETKGLMIPLGSWDDGGWTGVGANFAIPNSVYRDGVGLNTDEIKQGVALKMTVFNDSEVDFLSLRMAKFKVTEDEKDYVNNLDPETNFTTNDILGDKSCRLLRVHQHRNTAPIYKDVKTIAVPPKQLVVLDKSYLAPIFMTSATIKNKYWAYGLRIDFDTRIQVKVEIHSKVYNVNPNN